MFVFEEMLGSKAIDVWGIYRNIEGWGLDATFIGCM